jgi:isopenicillin-N N-acyltransferase like protein
MITGYSSQHMAISEIGVAFPDDSFGQGTDDTPPQKVHGKPWSFVTRDTMQYTSSIEDGLASIENSNRTCNLIIGLGDGKAKVVNGIEYSGYVAVPYNDSTLLPVNETWHQQIPNVVYNGMDWLCPSFNSVLGQQLQTYLGKLEPSVVIHDILPTTQTGNLHIAIFDLTQSKVYVSFCRGSKAPDTEPLYAYERQFTQLDMGKLFADAKP